MTNFHNCKIVCKSSLTNLAIFMLVLGLCSFVHATPQQIHLPQKSQPFLASYCFECHDSKTREGGVDLETLALEITTVEQAEKWQKVLNVLNSGEMPPEDYEQPDNIEKANFLDGLAQTMVAARRALSDSGGNIMMRRLNRREYSNTIEHLLGVKIDASSLPADGGSGSFDTVGAAQFISSDQIEQYLKLGRSAIDEAFERRAATGQITKTFRVEPEDTVNVKSRKNIAKQEEVQKRYLLWKAEVDKISFLPENEEALAQIREKFKIDDLTDNLRLYQNTGLLKGAPDATKFGFLDGNAAAFSNLGYSRTHAYMKHYLELPNSDWGTYLKLTWGIQRIEVVPDPKDVPPGTYKLRIQAGAVKGSDSTRHFIEVGHPHRVNGQPAGFSGKPLTSFQVTGTEENPEIIETTLVIGSNTPRELGIRERQPEDSKRTLRNEFSIYKQKNGYGTPPAIWVDWIELTGPISETADTNSKIVRIEPEQTINPDNEKEIAQIEERQKRFGLWKKGVDEAARTPENQAIIAEIRKTDRLIDHPNRFYTFADRLKDTPDPRDFGFSDAKKAAASDPSRSRSLALHKHYVGLPHRDRGTYLKLAHGTGRIIVPPKKKELPPGSYVMRVRVGAVEGTPAERRFIQVGHPQRQIESRNWGLEGRAISTHQVTGTIDNPETIEIPLEVTANTIREFAIQEKQPNNGNLKALWDAHNNLEKENGYGHPPAIWIDWVELEGPHSSTHKQWKQRREVELHANAKVSGTYNGWFKGGHDHAKAFLETGKPQQGIIDEKQATFRIAQFEEQGATFRRYLNDPLTKNGSFLTLSPVNKEEFIALPPEHPSGWLKTKQVAETLPSGQYKLRFRIGAVEGSPSERHFVDLGAVPGKDQFHHLSTFQITGSTSQPQTIEVPVQLTKDGPRKFALREKRDIKTDQTRYKAALKKTGVGPDPALWIDWVEWEGPLGPSTDDSRRNDWWITDAIDPDDSSRARKILQQFAFKAFRGVEAEVEFIDRLTDIFAVRRESGDSFKTAIRLPLSIILASPSFLYLNEPSNAVGSRQLSDRELAVRMAYFLWSGPPDAELLKLAEQNTLHLQETLRQQVDRMIADPRSDEFVSGFVHQWLDMERLDFFQFDVNLHRDFDESTRAATREEVYQSFAHLLRDSKDGRIGKLLKTDYVFVNGLLATYYGIEGVSGDKFQKIKLPADSPRGGLLGMAAIHAMGSDGIDSSPIERGAWVLRHLLNDPPPPAPPNVPQISRLNDQVLTTRERLLAHQEEAQCASCHRKIDPIGFGLENFNAAGKWRTTDHAGGKGKKGKTWTIDASGAFHKGSHFSDYHDLRDLITEREGDFARGLTEHLIEYGLGRPFGFSDEHLADGIVGSAKTKRFSLSEFIHALVQSKAFQAKTSATKNSPGDKQSKFESELFKTGTLVYSDDFDGEFNQQRFGFPKKDKSIKDGKLIVTSLFTSQEEAIAALKRDHHLGLEPVVHLNRIPEQFVCHMRYKFEKKDLTPGRPSFQIGHHMIVLSYLEGGGHRIKLPDGPTYTEPESDMKLNEWIDLIIEYKKGAIRISVNGCSKTYEHETVTVVNENDKNGPRFSLKGGSDCQIVFDSVRLWECGKKGKQ